MKGSKLMKEPRCLYLFVLFLSLSAVVDKCKAISSREPNEDINDVQASFYGESYIFVPLQDDTSYSHVSLDFRSQLPYGLLFLAAGQTDYIMLQFNAGMLEARINLGSGEAVTFSARGVRLDDSRWHSVELNRSLDHVLLSVDGIEQGQASTPGTYHDLNVDVGVLLGGSGHLKKEFYQNAQSFRGCLRNVIFNGNEVLQEAQKLRSAQNAFQVGWQCDEIFSAPSSSAISLQTETSFVAFPFLRVYPNSDGLFSCEFKTRSKNAVLLFNAGQGKAWEDFIAVELVSGQPKLSINKGSGVIEVMLEAEVNDGIWHKLEVSVSESTAQLTVDTHTNLTRFLLGGQNYLNLAGNLYIGGVGFNIRSQAIRLDLASLKDDTVMKGSMLGCFRDIRMNDRNYGFQQIESSRLIQVGCNWEFPCAQDPCVSNAQCQEIDQSQFKCLCEEENCVKEEFRTDGAGSPGFSIRGVVSVLEMKVVSGGIVAINTNTVRINRQAVNDLRSLQFTIRDRPRQGVVDIQNRRGSVSSFSYDDLQAGNVVYRSYGGRSSVDSIGVEMVVSMREKYDFVIPVRIVPNHIRALEVLLPSGNVISLTNGAKIKITQSILDAKSTTSDAYRLHFAVSYLRVARSMFEHIRQPGVSITLFTLKDVQDGLIWFKHNGDRVVYTQINVTDGVSTSDVMDLRFRELELRLSLANNSGILLNYGSSCLITSQNLSVVTSSPFEELDIMYGLTRPPGHGVLQYNDPDLGRWVDVETFTQRQIDSGSLRYLHTPQSISKYDSFTFEVEAKSAHLPGNDFSIRFRTISLIIAHTEDLLLSGVSYGKFDQNTLLVLSQPNSRDDANIVYTVLREPRQGDIYLIKRQMTNELMFSQFTPLRANDSFTQADVNNGYIYYKFKSPGSAGMRDFLDLQASYFGFSIRVQAVVEYSPVSLSDLQVNNNGLHDVPEGGYKIFTEDNLSAKMAGYTNFQFTILKTPAYGRIDIVNTGRNNTSVFTLREIQAGRVLYRHDDSETTEDSFVFMVSQIFDSAVRGNPEEIQEVRGTFQIYMKMKNDNSPVRTVKRVFKVASGQQKRLTINDLAFHDPDVDFDDRDLKYFCQPISNGEILRAGQIVLNFTQQELLNEVLIFQHHGDVYGRTTIIVTDGELSTNALFEIQASPPYIVISNNTRLSVEIGKSAVISSGFLSIETNVEHNAKSVIFTVTESPEHGQLRIGKHRATSFNYQNILDNEVSYFHDSSASNSDQFTFRADLGSVSTTETFELAIEASSDQLPPEIVHNRILRILALQTKPITPELLHVIHRGTKPEDINYVVTKLPETGHLVVSGKVFKPGQVPEFTQEDINNELVEYASDASGKLNDKMVFDVGTESQSLQQLEFLIEIIPLSLPHNEANLTVEEGDSVMISMKSLALKGRLAQNRAVQFSIQNVPVHGKVVLRSGRKDTQISSFNYDDIYRRRLYYVHDGSESLSDELTIRTDSPDGSSVSQLSTVYLEVTPVDDQMPTVMVNTGMDLWTGSVALLTNKHLQAADADTPSTKVMFLVSTPTNAHMAYLNNTLKAITRFSQRDIDAGQVVIVHTGEEQGQFKFEVTDGKNTGPQQVFRISARPVRLEIAINKTIMAFPNSLQPITNSFILVKTSSENFSQPILFTLVSPKPTKGWLVTKIGQHLQDLTSFTQQDIDEGKVFFKHTSPQSSWTEFHKIYFDISTMHAQPLSRAVFYVESSYSNLNDDNYRSVFKMHTPIIDEGEKITLSRSYFDATEMIENISAARPDVEVELSIGKKVRSGYLKLKKLNVEEGDIFTQDDINRGELVYKHDHSDTRWDMFQFIVKIIVPRSHSQNVVSTAHGFNFTIDIKPVNDQDFRVITRHPRIEVLQGSEVDITADNLTTVDLDTGPEGIEYTIETQPDNGMVVSKLRPYTRLTTFTQKEINDGMIKFVHDGTRKASSSLFLKVWDKVFGPAFENMDITVHPLIIKQGPGSFIPLVQGSRSVTLSNNQLKITTNGNRNSLHYKVTQAPQFGRLQYFGNSASEFSQRDVDNGWVVYLQNNDSPGDDYFVCDIDLKDIDCNLDTVQFEILMKPLVKVGPLLSSSDSHVAITRSSLDVSELAQITNDTPNFKVSVPPKYGQLMLKTRMRRETNPLGGEFHPVTSNFTFDDILYTRLYYVAGRSGAEEDQFEYILSAKGVPPAKGVFKIQLEPTDGGFIDRDMGNSGNGETPDFPKSRDDGTPVDPPGTDAKGDAAKEAAATQPESTDNNMKIIIAVTVSLLLIIIIVIIIILIMRWRRKRHSSPVQEVHSFKPRPYISGPLQLEQPHVLIEPKHESSLTPGGGEETMLMSSSNDNTYVNTSMVHSNHEDQMCTPLLQSSHPGGPGTPDVTVIRPDGSPDQGSEEQERLSIMTTGRESNASADLTDWTLMDPDILQHCRTTTPVLRNQKHWF